MIKKHFLIIIFLCFFFAITTYKFISHPTPFYDWDESIYAQVGREMIRSKSLVPLWQGQNWLDKPPLVPLTYGIVETLSPFSPEISTRMFTLFMATIILAMVYVLYYRLTKNIAISTLTVILTSFTTIFLQRAQVLNVDIFLFLGWMGYLIFYKNFWISLLFLGIGVLSKSLLGFYPLIGFFFIFTAQLFLKQIKFKEFKHNVKRLFLQGCIFLSWYVLMMIIFKMSFIQAHFVDSHLKRVTASIESHFGKRTFYIDLLLSQLGNIVYLSLLGIILIFQDSWKKRDVKTITLHIFFVPWFLFLNLTKTKIDWYLYPVLAQFIFLELYLLQFFKKKQIFLIMITIGIGGFVVFQNVIKGQFFITHYSQYDEYYNLSIYAKQQCNNINILVDKDSRNTHDTLKSMNLLIGTSEWWGNHPSIVYYSDKKVNFIYETPKFYDSYMNSKSKQCYVLDKKDLSNSSIQSYVVEKKFKDIYLITKP